MAHNETDEHLTSVLRKVKGHGGIAAVASLTDLSRRTLYRHAEDATDGGEDPPVMGPDTRRELLLLFDEHGLLDDPSELAYARAVVDLKRRASSLVDRADLAAGEAEGAGGAGRGRRAE